MAGRYDSMSCCALFDVVTNRVSVINQILGCKYDFQIDNPLLISSRRGRVSVTVYGAEFASSRMSDSDGLKAMLYVLDSLKAGLWLLSRGGVDFKRIQFPCTL